MREIALFVEDFAHQKVIGTLVQRLADEYSIAVRFNWRSAIRGHGRVVRELRSCLLWLLWLLWLNFHFKTAS